MNASNNVRDLSPSRRLTLSPSHPFISKGTVVFLGVNASYSHSSLALWILREIAEREGWKTRLIEMTVNDDVLAALARVSVTSPDVLAASAYLFNRPFLLSFLRRFKALHPNCVVIGGGPEFLGDSRHFLRCETAMDVVARGEGERVFPAFLQAAHQP
ncbi:MAG: cobalamin B12-binding domain-containing protein, partial [Lentisphaerae bacterium]|nr:cobalamin B12-binding domain-containing protein [Lentisphaerota bacterium]